MVGILVHGDNHFIVRGPRPDRATAVELARHWSLIRIGGGTPSHLEGWRISTREFREDLEWAVVVAGEGEMSPAVVQLIAELRARRIEIMDTALNSVEEYLHTSYSPDREYRDGVLIERNVGDNSHSLLQAAIAAYFRKRRKKWHIEVYTELRIRMRENWYPLPDVCVYELPAPEERFPSRPPLLWIEILSEDDRMIDVWEKARDLITLGVPYVWIINPKTLESELRTSEGTIQVTDKTLRLPNSPIVVPLVDVLAE